MVEPSDRTLRNARKAVWFIIHNSGDESAKRYCRILFNHMDRLAVDKLMNAAGDRRRDKRRKLDG